jgi:hypothetical protein
MVKQTFVWDISALSRNERILKQELFAKSLVRSKKEKRTRIKILDNSSKIDNFCSKRFMLIGKSLPKRNVGWKHYLAKNLHFSLLNYAKKPNYRKLYKRMKAYKKKV